MTLRKENEYRYLIREVLERYGKRISKKEGDMVTVVGVDLVILMEEEVMAITVVGVITMVVEVGEAIEVVHSVVVKVLMMVGMAKFLRLQPNLMAVLVETTHLRTVLMVEIQIMKRMWFLRLQAIQVDLHLVLHHMGVMP